MTRQACVGRRQSGGDVKSLSISRTAIRPSIDWRTERRCGFVCSAPAAAILFLLIAAGEADGAVAEGLLTPT